MLFSENATLSIASDGALRLSAVVLLPKSVPPATVDAALHLAVAPAQGILVRRTGSSAQVADRLTQRTSQDQPVPKVNIARAVIDGVSGMQTAHTRRHRPSASVRRDGVVRSARRRVRSEAGEVARQHEGEQHHR